MKIEDQKRLRLLVLCVLCFALGLSIPILINRTDGSASAEKNKFETIYSVLTNEWYFAKSAEDLETQLYESAIDGMTHLEQDAHTNYFDLEQAQQFASELEGSNVGLGFLYFQDDDGNMQVREVYMNSGAYKAGLQDGDVITAVDKHKCADTDDEEIVKYIQSNKDKELTIQYIRNGKKQSTKAVPSDYDTSVALQLMEDHAYISINSFSEQTGQEFKDAMSVVKKNKLKNLVLDLRGNSGGYLYATLEVASSLVADDTVIFQEEDAKGNITKRTTQSEIKAIPMDTIVILQNGKTASASEALIMALKEKADGKVITVGTTTYGKGTEQMQLPFADGTSLKYTVARWLSPSGKSIDQKGIDADVEIKTEKVRSTNYYEMEEDEVIEADTVHDNAKALQVYLKYLGYDVDRTDTYFSPKSSAALASFQQDKGLSATGNCDQKTWEAVHQAVLVKVNRSGLSKDRQYQKALEQF